jgi:hypothetical protein
MTVTIGVERLRRGLWEAHFGNLYVRGATRRETITLLKARMKAILSDRLDPIVVHAFNYTGVAWMTLSGMWTYRIQYPFEQHSFPVTIWMNTSATSASTERALRIHMAEAIDDHGLDGMAVCNTLDLRCELEERRDWRKLYREAIERGEDHETASGIADARA